MSAEIKNAIVCTSSVHTCMFNNQALLGDFTDFSCMTWEIFGYTLLQFATSNGTSVISCSIKRGLVGLLHS